MLTIGKWVDSWRSFITGKEKLITKATVIAGLDCNSYNNSKVKTTLNYQFISFQNTVQFVCNAFLNDIKNK
jgi:hypothetical protein